MNKHYMMELSEEQVQELKQLMELSRNGRSIKKWCEDLDCSTTRFSRYWNGLSKEPMTTKEIFEVYSDSRGGETLFKLLELNGYDTSLDLVDCKVCNGSGSVDDNLPVGLSSKSKCLTCGATGRVFKRGDMCD